MPPKKVHNALRALAIKRGVDVENDVVTYKALAERKKTIGKRGHASKVCDITYCSCYVTYYFHVTSHTLRMLRHII